MKKILYIASKNPGKILEYKKLLSEVNCQLVLQPDFIEIIESGKTFKENAAIKACEVSKKMKNYAIADDSGLCIEALNGKPGIHSSRYADNDQERIKRVLSELEGIEDRRAFFIANVCVASPVGELVLDIEARCYGNILLQSRGNNGFGYDPIFQEKNTELTFAEMTDDLKDKLSHRGKAASKVIPELIKIFSDI
tara:strand:+ start:5567 stop:6151 length:585 start_codon:yes stop_codon:yes gene_type:complete